MVVTPAESVAGAIDALLQFSLVLAATACRRGPLNPQQAGGRARPAVVRSVAFAPRTNLVASCDKSCNCLGTQIGLHQNCIFVINCFNMFMNFSYF